MLSEECINNQLIPADILKKSKFKSDWPFNRRKRGHRCPNNRHHFDEDSEEDSYNILNQSDSSEDSDEMSEDEDISNMEQELEQMELQRMEEESYLSIS